MAIDVHPNRGTLASGLADSTSSWLLRAGGLIFIDASAIYLLYNMFNDGIWQLGLVLALVTVLLNIIFLRQDLFPLRWIAPGLALLIVIVVYPILSTVYLAFTNYGDGHLLSKELAIQQIEKERFLDEDATVYAWTAFVGPNEQYILWLDAPDGSESLIVRPGQEPEVASGEIPEEIDGYRRLNKIEQLKHTTNLVAIEFGVGEDAFQVSDKVLGQAARFRQRYVYDAAEDAFIDQQSGTKYRAQEGTFTADNGEVLRPGFRVPIGAKNFTRLFTNRSLFEPFIAVFLWTIGFALLSVLTTFALGLFLAVIFDYPGMPFQRILRSLLLVPYAIPAFITVPIWVGLLNPQFGVLSQAMASTIGWVPPWFSDPIWSKVGIILINLWLGFPYMFVICTGALQALPSDIYEAADIDGANGWQQFWAMTLPLLMITIGPLLVASFAFNFNNFVIIDLYNEGGPPMSGTSSPVGHTDILATYTFRLAFSSGRGADLGYAAAISVAIFLILVVITFFQFRYTNMLEEASENV